MNVTDAKTRFSLKRDRSGTRTDVGYGFYAGNSRKNLIVYCGFHVRINSLIPLFISYLQFSYIIYLLQKNIYIFFDLYDPLQSITSMFFKML